jgi:hypothetical protein
MSVLDSCENPDQIETAQKLFNLYLKKWGKDISEVSRTTLVDNFDKESKSKHYKLKKNKSFFSKFSQLFLF